MNIDRPRPLDRRAWLKLGGLSLGSLVSGPAPVMARAISQRLLVSSRNRSSADAKLMRGPCLRPAKASRALFDFIEIGNLQRDLRIRLSPDQF